MFRRKRGDTSAGAIERQYGVVVNARSDALLGNLLMDRGFDSLTQFVTACRGGLTYHARKRHVFLSFHAEDRAQVAGFRLMAKNPNLDLGFHDASVRTAVRSDESSYVRSVIKDKIARSSVILCLIGNGTAWRDWVEWELDTARQLGKGLCGVRLKGSRGRTPQVLLDTSAPVARWEMNAIVAAIECAAARRS